jgi:hypothetical protein
MAYDPIIMRELPVIEQIIRDETWLEGERRGDFVSPEDPIVRENVCRIVVRIGAELREMAVRSVQESSTSPRWD